MHMQSTRRDFMKSATAAAVATATIPAMADEKKKPLFNFPGTMVSASHNPRWNH